MITAISMLTEIKELTKMKMIKAISKNYKK
jgi:hypothetical protein